MTDLYEEQNQYNNKNYNANQLRTNHIRLKKNSMPHDREQLYAENLELKNKNKELLQINTKLKTQLSITQKEKINLCNIAEEQVFNPKIAPRSNSGNHKKSGANLLGNHQSNIQSMFNNPMHKEKQSLAFKKIVRDQNLQLEKLNNENARLKKTMKYTRMSQLLTENKQLLDETIRLKGIIAEHKQNENLNYNEFANQIEGLRRKLAQEKDSEKRNGYELKKQLEINVELKEKLGQIQSKKIDLQKRLNKQLKLVRGQLSDYKSKIYEQTVVKGKQCEQCTKLKREKNQFKRKYQSNENEIKRLKQEINQLRRQKDYQIKRVNQTVTSKTPEVGHSRNLTVIKNQENKKVINNQSHVSEKNNSKRIKSQNEQTKKITVLTSPQITTNKSNEIHIQTIQKNNSSQVKIIQNANVKKEIKNEAKKKTTEGLQQDSMDTEKLLESVQLEKPSDIKVEQKVEKKAQKSVAQPITIKDKKLEQSDGQYQELNYDDFQIDESMKKSGKQKAKSQRKEEVNKQKSQKEQKLKKEIDKEKNQKQKKTGNKNKQKLTKKSSPAKKDQDEQILYNAQEQKEKIGKQIQGDKAQLKIIKETLIYKFMAQSYTYDNFCNDINSSDMKEFSITEVMSLLTAEPFLLGEQQVEHVLAYLYETTQPTGQESLSAQNFMKKMKKFIGKAKAVNEQTENSNIQILSEIVKKDEEQSGKIRKKCVQLDQGNGTITKQQFIKVMGYMKVKDGLLQTAISQIAYISDDLNHLNYDFFLRRFSNVEE